MSVIKLSLPEEVKFIIKTLNEHGHRADVVGGAVRDACIGRTTSDYDITTDALPEEIKRVFSGVRTIDTGIKHGTVALHLGGENYEVTTYRRDGDYLDARHPETVEFTESLAEDVRRRDFTMNALCYNETDGITDFVGGVSDIENRLIRTVGDPVTRFSEDALRILRALRFSAVLGFSIEKSTAEAVHSCKELLFGISRERIYAEWQKLISGDNAYAVIEEYCDVFATFLPISFDSLPPRESFFCGSGLVRTLALFALGSENPAESYDAAMSALKTDKATRVGGRDALLCLGDGVPKDKRDALLALSKYGEEVTRTAVRVAEMIGKCEEDRERLIDEAIASGIPYSLKSLAVSGDDLGTLGFKGEKIGEELKRLLLIVIDGKCENTKSALLGAVTA